MSVTSFNPGQDESEVHDLVLMFANSRMPRGSDAFQSILDDFLPSDDNENDDNDSSDSTSSVGGASKDTDKQGYDEVDAGPCHRKSISVVSPAKLAHVHWPDELNRKLASSPAESQRHHARLFVKTTPVKPILKHDETLLSDESRESSAKRKT